MTVYDIIKKHIDTLDYLGFLKMGAPEDEYDLESQLIHSRLPIHPSENIIAKTICDVFSAMFSQKFDIVDFSETARNIYIDLKISNLI